MVESFIHQLLTEHLVQGQHSSKPGDKAENRTHTLVKERSLTRN